VLNQTVVICVGCFQSKESESAYRQQCTVLDVELRKLDSELKRTAATLLTSKEELTRKAEECTAAETRIRELVRVIQQK
jgi:hypothetical protein